MERARRNKERIRWTCPSLSPVPTFDQDIASYDLETARLEETSHEPSKFSALLHGLLRSCFMASSDRSDS